MKKQILLLTAVLVLLVLPVVANAAPDVRASLTINDVFISPGENAVLEIEVVNHDSSSAVTYGCAAEGVPLSRPITIYGGGTYTYYLEVPVDFGMNTEKGITATVDVEALGTISTNTVVVYEQLPAPTLTTNFSVTPSGNVPTAPGEAVEYAISMTNTGSVFYGPIEILMDGTQIVPDFDLTVGQTRTFTHTQSYMSDTTHTFSYAVTYYHNGIDHGFTLNNPINVQVDVLSIPAATPVPPQSLAGVKLRPSWLSAMVEAGGSMDVTLIFENNSGQSLKNVRVTDAFGMDYGGWSLVGNGQTAAMTVGLAPTEPTIYAFSATAMDQSNNTYVINANPISLTIGEMPTPTPQASDAIAAPQKPATPLPGAVPAANFGSRAIYILLGAIVFALLAGIIVIIIVANKRK